jgi:hypothetical protein
MSLFSTTLWFLYALKLTIISSWLAHSIYLMTFPYSLLSRNLNVYWNLISSLFILFLDILAHVLYFFKNSIPSALFDVILILFLVGVGPIMIFLSLFGSFTDSINYDQELCKRGCVITK